MLEGGAPAAGAALASHAAAGPPLGVLDYGLAFALAGLGVSAVRLAGTAFVLDFGTDADRPAYLGLASLAQVPFARVGPLMGGVLADRLGDGTVFLLSLVLGLAGRGLFCAGCATHDV